MTNTERLTKIEAATGRIEADVKCIKTTLVGNGDSGKGLIGKTAAHSKWLWLLSLIVLALLGAALSGCIPTTPANSAAPRATVSPAVFAETMGDLKQDIDQVQNTIQTNNYAMDAERRQWEETRLEEQSTQHKRELLDAAQRTTQMMAVVIGALLIALAMKAPAAAVVITVLFLSGIGCMIAAVVGPMLSGWIQALF